MPRPSPETTFNLKLMSSLPPDREPKQYDMHVEIIDVGTTYPRPALRYIVHDAKGIHTGILREDHMPDGINFPKTTDLEVLEEIKKDILTHREMRGNLLTKMDPSPSVATIRKPAEYAQRHVVGKVSMASLFKGYPQESAEQKNIKSVFLKHSRLLQPEFLSDSIREVLFDDPNAVIPENRNETALEIMRLASMADLELGDIVVPSYDAVMMIHIAAELVVKYQVAADDLQQHADAIFELINGDGRLSDTIKDDVEDAKAAITDKQVLKRAKILYLKEYLKKPGLSEDDKTWRSREVNTMELEDFREAPKCNDYLKIARLQLQKEATNKVTNETVPFLMDKKPSLIQRYLDKKGIDPKPTRNTADGRHVSILGAAGSGKSTITAGILDDEGKNKEEYAVIATDDYRGVYIPGTNDHEGIKTSQVFTRTQDSAGLVKDVVLERLKQMQTMGRAPDILVDGIKVNSPIRNLLKTGKNIASANVCLPDATKIAERAYLRAETATGVADRGRHVNTSDLIKGHAIASSVMLDSLPVGVETKLYNSAVKFGEPPKHCGTVDTTDADDYFITILDVANLSKFLAKKHLQESSQSTAELYQARSKSSRQFMLDTQYKAEAILGLIDPTNPNDPSYELKFEDSHGALAISICRGRLGDYMVCVTNKEALDNILRNTTQAPVMKALITRVHAANLYNAGRRKEDREENYLDSSAAARAEFLYSHRRNSRFSDPGSFTEFILGRNTSFREAYRDLVGQDFYQGLENKSQEQLYKDRIFEMKKAAKAAIYDAPFHVNNEIGAHFNSPESDDDDYLVDEEYENMPLREEYSRRLSY